MARQALGPASLAVGQSVALALARVPAAAPVVVGVSGGADSMALAGGVVWALKVAERAGQGPAAAQAVVVDHGVQPGSAAVSSRVAERVNSLGLDCQVRRVHVDSGGAGPEAAARLARYAALRDVAGAGGVIMVGHTLDDQAESVLLGLARGSGLRSLSGMAPRRDDVLRPLLGLRREVTRRACREQGIEVWDDPHNQDPRFRRVRVRHDVLPMLEHHLGPGVAEALARTAELARADADALDQWAGAARALVAVTPTTAPMTPDELDCPALADLPRAVAGRVLRSWLVEAGALQPSAAHVAAVRALVDHWHGQGPVHLPGVVVSRVEGRLRVSSTPG